MSTAVEVAREVTAPAPAPRSAALRRAGPAERAVAAAAAVRPVRAGLAQAVWAVGRTGRAGLLGAGLLFAAGLFLASTHLGLAAEVEALRGELAAARARARTATAWAGPGPAAPARALPGRADVPAMLHELFGKALRAGLAVDSGRYDIRGGAASGGVVRTRVAFPVSGPYPEIRAFLDAALATMPAVALSHLVLTRRAIGDANVEAQIEFTVYTEEGGAARKSAAPGEAGRRFASARVVAPVHAAALFAQHSWHVQRPAPPAPPPPPPPAPTAPPFPYAFVGSYAPLGEAPVYFLSRGDRVIDARVGDKLDGVYRFESAAGGALVFVYLPLDVRQTLAAGVPK